MEDEIVCVRVGYRSMNTGELNDSNLEWMGRRYFHVHIHVLH